MQNHRSYSLEVRCRFSHHYQSFTRDDRDLLFSWSSAPVGLVVGTYMFAVEADMINVHAPSACQQKQTIQTTDSKLVDEVYCW